MTVNYLTDVRDRLLAMCKECIPDSDASADPLFIGEQYPYFVLSIDEYEPTEDSDDLSIRPYTWTIQYIVGPTDGGYKGQMSNQLYEDEPTILDYFMSRRNLQCTDHPTKCDFLQPGPDTKITRTAGMGAYNRTAIQQSVYGTVFQLRVTMAINIEQLYL